MASSSGQDSRSFRVTTSETNDVLSRSRGLAATDTEEDEEDEEDEETFMGDGVETMREVEAEAMGMGMGMGMGSGRGGEEHDDDEGDDEWGVPTDLMRLLGGVCAALSNEA